MLCAIVLFAAIEAPARTSKSIWASQYCCMSRLFVSDLPSTSPRIWMIAASLIFLNTISSTMYRNGLNTCSMKLSSGPSSRVAEADACIAAPPEVRPILDRGPAELPCTSCWSAPDEDSVACSDSRSAFQMSPGTLGVSIKLNALLTSSPSTVMIFPTLVLTI